MAKSYHNPNQPETPILAPLKRKRFEVPRIKSANFKLFRKGVIKGDDTGDLIKARVFVYIRGAKTQYFEPSVK